MSAPCALIRGSCSYLQEHQQLKAQAQAEAAAQEDHEEVEEDNHNMVNISNQLGMEVGHEEEDEETDEDESESQSKATSRNVSEIVTPGSAQRPVEPKPEEKQLSKKVCWYIVAADLCFPIMNVWHSASHVLQHEALCVHSHHMYISSCQPLL